MHLFMQKKRHTQRKRAPTGRSSQAARRLGGNTQIIPRQLIANREVNLVARVDGYLTAKTYTSGDLVHKGDVLFKIEEHNYIDAVQKAEADLSQAQANLEYASNPIQRHGRSPKG